ncbi:unnamed protein product [Porites lobata]|uniref:C3H1-type domain-containing protein n=1 Tax=Porites lobata TaxID=104759 RepID=A0ABN8QXJ9_9CNID|nr:unnamed protein product [Porites lobata]
MRTTNNSLSTMSSPVTASSPSSSGSTPAPTVNTSASPPSQPVSLPDTNALAQAISRALAESLPPLLSSLRDSSGGNSNTAAASVPLSSTSTSTQSPASSSSSTPGSTSQSSGTLVVPSFISTYSSSGGPSVVSSLPATSSANLPVVVGGSCGGATGTESSTLPNLNKAFVVGPGYAPVPFKLVSKITAGLFVDLADLLPDNIRAQEIEPQAFLEGKLVVSGSKKRVIEIADIITWIEAFTIFSMILCHTFPSRWKDLNQYKLLIIQTARRFSDKSWLHYDIAFRKEAAASGSTDWSCMHPDLYNFHTRSPVTTSTASGSSTSSASSLSEPLGSSGNPRSSQYCHSWNDGRCRWPFGRCRFRHSCESCHGTTPHPLPSPVRAERTVPLPFSVKGVSAVARQPLANSTVNSFVPVHVGSHGNFSALELRSPFCVTFSAAGSAKFQFFVVFSSCLSFKTINHHELSGQAVHKRSGQAIHKHSGQAVHKLSS